MKLDKGECRWADPPFLASKKTYFMDLGRTCSRPPQNLVQTRGTGSAVNILTQQKRAMKT
jgi:hypothetical protein